MCLLAFGMSACSKRAAVCTNIDGRWQAFVARSNACEQDSDCSGFEHGEYCSCAFLLQAALNKAEIPRAEAFVQEVEANCKGADGKVPWEMGGCDVGELYYPVRCEQHRCHTSSHSCLEVTSGRGGSVSGGKAGRGGSGGRGS